MGKLLIFLEFISSNLPLADKQVSQSRTAEFINKINGAGDMLSQSRRIEKAIGKPIWKLDAARLRPAFKRMQDGESPKSHRDLQA